MKLKKIMFFILIICLGFSYTEGFAKTRISRHKSVRMIHHCVTCQHKISRSVIKGTASWYGPGFQNKRTASGERYNMYKLTAAHKTLPLSTYVRVTNLKNGKAVVVKINDRGPFIRNRAIDLSYAAARQLGMVNRGLAPVTIKIL